MIKKACGVPIVPQARGIRCDLCASDQFHFYGRRGTYELVECAGCTLVTVAPFPTAAERAEMYEEERIEPWSPYVAFHQNRALLVESYRKLVRSFDRPRGSRLFEVGVGNGLFIEIARQAGYDVSGVDLSAENCEFSREMYGNEVIHGSIDDVTLAESSLDVIILNDVVEHVPSPKALLVRLRAALRPGGLLLIQTPNVGSLEARLFGVHWVCFTPPWHLYFFSERTLKRLLREVGFRLEKRFTEVSYLTRRVAIERSRWDFVPRKKISAIFRREDG